jgi:hypothetical protein
LHSERSYAKLRTTYREKIIVRIEIRMIPEQGVTLDGVWVSYELLGELDEQGVWDSQFGDAFIRLSKDQERVLIARGLAVKETRGGCHRGPKLNEFMDALEWPERKSSHA